MYGIASSPINYIIPVFEKPYCNEPMSFTKITITLLFDAKIVQKINESYQLIYVNLQ